mgnify:CR=1 FL=1
MDISVVIPLYNEAESLPELFAWIERVMKEHNFSYEVIFINDGRQTASFTLYTPQNAEGITFAAEGEAEISVEKYTLSF